jgi:hypothetical protein
MSDPNEKKKKIEEIRQRKLALANELKQINTGEVIPPKKDLAALAIEASEKPPAVNLENIKREGSILKDIMRKYRNENLNFTNFTETFVGFNPEMYDAETQSEFPDQDTKGDNSDDESTIHLKEGGKTLGHRPSAVMQSSKKKTGHVHGPPNTKKTQDFITGDRSMIEIEEVTNTTKIQKVLVSEDMRRQYLNSEDLSDFLANKRKLVERALGEKDIYDMFKTYYDEDDNDDIDISKRSWVTPAVEFFEESCNKRTVTSLEWSLKVK